MSGSSRPCLKARAHPGVQRLPSSLTFKYPDTSQVTSPHVHFPPTPGIVTSTFHAHSPSTYDRHPITVAPNGCALPHRGERDYEKASPASPPYSGSPIRSYFDIDRRILAISNMEAFSASAPDLMMMSSSDESTESFSPPTPQQVPHSALVSSDFPILPHKKNNSFEDIQIALSFLPHSLELGTGKKKGKKGGKSRPLARRSHTPPSTSSCTESSEDDGCLGGF